MGPGFGMSRPNQNMNMPGVPPPHTKAAHGPAPITPAADAPVHMSFNLPFSADLEGPIIEDIVHATPEAVERWTHPEDAPDDVPVWRLPVHTRNVDNLKKLCDDITSGPLPIEAHVVCSSQARVKGRQVVNVCLSGSPEMVTKTRETILNDLPLSLRCCVVDIDGKLILDEKEQALKTFVIEHLDGIASFCGVDIFLLGPKFSSLAPPSSNGEAGQDHRWRIAIYGDMESAEHAKTRVLLFIDRILGRQVDAVHLELSLHTVICGRSRKNIKAIESMTNTAIYFPPPFSQTYRYSHPGASKRNPEEIYITGESPQNIQLAKAKIHQLTSQTRLFMKDCVVSPPKIDSILLTRMDKVRKIMETNGTFVLFPQLGSQRNLVRIQGVEGLHVERTIRDIMALTGQFYAASWWIQTPLGGRFPNASDIRTMLADICATSDADVMFDKLTFNISGSDEAVKGALHVISTIGFVARSQYQIRVKIELANEHKEFVSGKKNGKINKIMGQASVQIIFDGFNEYNFYIDVCSPQYDAMKLGLSLVEQEMPASISFHVPDQYHKRIIGIGGQHIQRIMKKHSVFVKFSNAMDRGGVGRDEDDIKVDNVICRTPARNASALELVKAEILDMVDRADSEFTSQTVHVNRLYHRALMVRVQQLEELEKKWNCKINFPSTEQASDDVVIAGPEWQVPLCVDDFLGMVPDQHEIILVSSPALLKFLESDDFRKEITGKLKSQFVVELQAKQDPAELTADGKPTVTFTFTYTKNNAGGVKDALDFLIERLLPAGVELDIVKGGFPKQQPDTFEENLSFFNAKLLQSAPAAVSGTDSPKKSSFEGDVARERSNIFEKLRRPGSMASISNFLDRRKNSSNTAASFFRNGSGNVSKSSLISIESARSFNATRDPWNDSGVNLTEDDTTPWPRPYSNGNGSMHLAQPGLSGDKTPTHSMRISTDSGRPSTSHSTNSGYPGPPGPGAIGPPR